MCGHCGCGPDGARIEGEQEPIAHGHHHGASGPRDASHDARLLRIEQDILASNAAFAEANRRWLASRRISAFNLMSSPGSGKTTLLVRTLTSLGRRFAVSVIEGDQQTSNDADRIRATGTPALQINTGSGCHLDAHMVGHGLQQLVPPSDSLLLIENVGNLVCPAAFDLGELRKVVILSVTEGDDKPIKYPDIFAQADLVVLNKIDLLPYVDFDVERCLGYLGRLRSDLEMMQLSARTGDGLGAWLSWLARTHQQSAPSPTASDSEPRAGRSGPGGVVAV